ncbi:MAG: HNH endonuclease [Candidatus Obscuribacterales bacterium]
MQDNIQDQTPEWIKSSSSLYEDNYFLAFVQQQTSSPKITLTTSLKGTCRFCGKCKPNVTYKKDAHAFSESIGNKSIFVDYECDDCNQAFGSTIENEFGNWSLVYRTVSQVKGKRGTSTVKREHAGFRVDWADPTQLSLTMREDFPWCTIDEERKEIRIDMPQESYVPLSVFKAFVKMALMIIPEANIDAFDNVITWLGQKKSIESDIPLLVSSKALQTVIPGIPPPGWLFAALAVRKTDDLSLPYATFVLAFGNYAFQILLPCMEKHQNIDVTLIPFPIMLGVDPTRPIQPQEIDLSGTARMKNETVPTVFHFDVVEKIEHKMPTSESNNINESDGDHNTL